LDVAAGPGLLLMAREGGLTCLPGSGNQNNARVGQCCFDQRCSFAVDNNPGSGACIHAAILKFADRFKARLRPFLSERPSIFDRTVNTLPYLLVLDFSSPLKLMTDRVVCADGGNPDPTSTHGKHADHAKALELAGWPYPRHQPDVGLIRAGSIPLPRHAGPN
jgi:hypothetical protein